MSNFLKDLKPFSGLIPAVFVVTATAVSIPFYQKPVYKSPISTLPIETKEVAATEKKSKETIEKETETTKEKIKKLANVSDSDNLKDGTYQGSGTGFRGKITVEVVIKNHKISDIKVLSSSDDPAYFGRAKNLLSNIISSNSTNVDTVSGATYSSVGLIEAVRDALKKAGADTSKDSALPTLKRAGTGNGGGANVSLVGLNETGKFKDGKYYGSAKGFRGNISVEVIVKNGKIVKINVLNSSDDPAYFGRAKNLISNIIANNSTNVDTVSGATYSSAGLINAVRNALKNAGSTEDIKTTKPEKKAEQESIDLNNYEYIDGVYEGEAEGFRGPVKVEITIKSGKIENIEVISYKDDDKYFSKALGLIGNIISLQSTGVDTVSGATFSSKGIIGAVNDALSKARSEKVTNASTTTTTETTTTVITITEPAEHGPYIDGVYNCKAEVIPNEFEEFETYSISFSVKVENGFVVSINNLLGYGEGYDDINNIYLENAKSGILSQINSKGKADDVDVVSGATCSSKAIISGLNMSLILR